MRDEEAEEDHSISNEERQQEAKYSSKQYLLEVVKFLYEFGFALMSTVCYQYVYWYSANVLHIDLNNQTTNSSTICDVNKSSHAYQLQQQVGEVAASWQLYFSLASGIPSLFACVIYGTYSDKFGRRTLLFISTAGIGSRAVVYALVVYLSLPIQVLFVGHILEGMSGAYVTMGIACYTYAADVTGVGYKRSMRMVIIDTIGNLADGSAFFVSGYAISGIGHGAAFLITIGVFAAAIITIVFIPESRRGAKMEKMGFARYIYRAFRFYTEKSSKNPSRYIYLICGVGMFFIISSGTHRFGIETLYLLDTPFCWGTVLYGNYQATGAILRGITGVIVIRLLLCASNEITITPPLCAIYMSSFILEGFAKTNTVIYIVSALQFPVNLVTILPKSIMSKHTDKDHQGALFASIQLTDTICNTLAGVVTNVVYEHTVQKMKGAVFLMMASSCFIGTATMTVLLIVSRRKSSKKTIN